MFSKDIFNQTFLDDLLIFLSYNSSVFDVGKQYCKVDDVKIKSCFSCLCSGTWWNGTSWWESREHRPSVRNNFGVESWKNVTTVSLELPSATGSRVAAVIWSTVPSSNQKAHSVAMMWISLRTNDLRSPSGQTWLARGAVKWSRKRAVYVSLVSKLDRTRERDHAGNRLTSRSWTLLPHTEWYRLAKDHLKGARDSE